MKIKNLYAATKKGKTVLVIEKELSFAERLLRKISLQSSDDVIESHELV